jgi:hypothetical protein
VDSLKASKPVDPKLLDKAVKEFNSTRSAWRDRKANCIEALEVVADGMGKKLKVVMVGFYFTKQ